MKRNSKRFLALFLSVAMTITPAVLTQAEGKDVNVLVTATPTPAAEEKAADMDDQKTASEDTSNTASSE